MDNELIDFICNTKKELGICSVAHCKNKARRRMLCAKHYSQIGTFQYPSFRKCSKCEKSAICLDLCLAHFKEIREVKKKSEKK